MLEGQRVMMGGLGVLNGKCYVWVWSVGVALGNWHFLFSNFISVLKE